MSAETHDYHRLARHASVWHCAAYQFDPESGERVNTAYSEHMDPDKADAWLTANVSEERPYAEAIRHAVNLVDFDDDEYGTVHDAEYGDELGRHMVDVWGGDEYEDNYRDDLRPARTVSR